MPKSEPLHRFEQALIGAGSAAWLLVLGGQLGLPLAGTLDMDLYRLYSFAGLFGWASGNIYVLRRRRRYLLAYLLAPAGFVSLLRALASSSLQQAAPLVPLYAFFVYLIFFLVPVTLKGKHG